jgi:tetratricopeptide (TPR) repeat protein
MYGALLLLAAVPALGGWGACQPSGAADRATSTWLARARSKKAEDRETAARMLGTRRGQESEAVPELIRLLEDDDEHVKAAALESLRALLRRPQMTGSAAAWRDLWRTEERGLVEERKLPASERLKRDKATLHGEEGYYAMLRGDYARAESLFLQAVSEDPKEPRHWNNLGKCYANQGRWPDAVDKYRRALEADAEYSPAHFNLAQAFLEMSRLTGHERLYEALGHADVAIRLDTREVKGDDGDTKVIRKEWAPRWLKAEILFEIARAATDPEEKDRVYRHAAEAIGEAVEIPPDSAEKHRTAALIYYGMELYYRAYLEAKKVHELGYDMSPDFLEKLEQRLRKEAYRAGVEPPEMPRPEEDAAPPDGPPPALRLPFGGGE